MATKVPQKNDFDVAENAAKRVHNTQWSSAGVSALYLILSRIFPECELMELIFSVVGLLLIGLIMYFKWHLGEVYRKAEETRRDGFIDNAFDIQLADIESKAYYDTDDLNPGIIKMLANVHENSIFSGKVVEGMLRKTEVPMLIGALVVVAIAVTNFCSSQFTISVINVLLTLDFLGDFIKLWRLKKDCENIQKDCKAILNAYKNADGQKNPFTITARAIRTLIQYETALAYAATMFDTSVFNELNTTETTRWNRLKKRFYK